MMNVDEKHTAFYKEQSVRSFVKEVTGDRRIDSRSMKTLNDHLKGLQISVGANTNLYFFTSLSYNLDIYLKTLSYSPP